MLVLGIRDFYKVSCAALTYCAEPHKSEFKLFHRQFSAVTIVRCQCVERDLTLGMLGRSEKGAEGIVRSSRLGSSLNWRSC